MPTPDDLSRDELHRIAKDMNAIASREYYEAATKGYGPPSTPAEAEKRDAFVRSFGVPGESMLDVLDSAEARAIRDGMAANEFVTLPYDEPRGPSILREGAGELLAALQSKDAQAIRAGMARMRERIVCNYVHE